jgi:hypothetical protein
MLCNVQWHLLFWAVQKTGVFDQQMFVYKYVYTMDILNKQKNMNEITKRVLVKKKKRFLFHY